MQNTVSQISVSKTEAFNALGYEYKATRGVWTAEKSDSVLVTLWQRTIRWGNDERGSYLYVDLEELLEDGCWARTIAALPENPRHQTRANHLRKALFEGARLDVVILLGPVDNASGRSLAWVDGKNENLTWRVVHVAEDTGHYRVEARKNWS